MADISGAEEKYQISNKGDLVIRARYEAEDNSAEMIYSYNCPDTTSRARNDLWTSATGIYMGLPKIIPMLYSEKALELVEMSAHEVFRDEYGNIRDEYILGTYTY